jgi:hypothetical protein
MNQTTRKLQHLVQASLSSNKVEPNKCLFGWEIQPTTTVFFSHAKSASQPKAVFSSHAKSASQPNKAKVLERYGNMG